MQKHGLRKQVAENIKQPLTLRCSQINSQGYFHGYFVAGGRAKNLASASNAHHAELGRLAAVSGSGARIAERGAAWAGVISLKEGVQVFLKCHDNKWFKSKVAVSARTADDWQLSNATYRPILERPFGGGRAFNAVDIEGWSAAHAVVASILPRAADGVIGNLCKKRQY